MKKEYMTFVEDIEELAEGKEIQLTLRDLTPGRRKYGARIVKALVSNKPSALPDGDTLWVRSWLGVPYPEPWAIKVVGDAGETLPGMPHEDFIKARKGR